MGYTEGGAGIKEKRRFLNKGADDIIGWGTTALRNCEENTFKHCNRGHFESMSGRRL